MIATETTVKRLYLTIEEVAESLRVSAKTVRRLIARGKLQSTRIGVQHRIRPEWVAAYAERKNR